MSGEPSIPPAPISAASSTSSLWDRLTEFASQHRRTIIYTTVTATFIIGAGGIWYYVQQQQSDKDKDADSKRKREKNSKKKKAKQNPVDDEENQVEQKPNGTLPR
jgi:mitochondrial import receptor subunit TOM70